MDNCYGKGDRIPRELLHTQDERLTNKHIETLSFLQEMAKENRALKQRVEELEKSQEGCKELHALAQSSQARIKEIQQQYLNRADEINQMLSDQHRAEMMEVMDDKLEMERSLKEQILKLRHEIDSLQRTNVELREDPYKTEEKEKFKSRITELELIVEGLLIEVKEMTAEKKKLQHALEESQAHHSELHQLQDLRSLNHQLIDELREANQKNIELVFSIDKLEKEKREDQAEKDQTRLVESLQYKLSKVLKEKELAIIMESEARVQNERSKEEINTLSADLEILKEEHKRLMTEHGQLCIEYGKVRRRMQQDEDKAAFREFVAMKRELIAVKNENEALKLKARTASGNALPMLKEDIPPPNGNKPTMKKGKKKLLAITLAPGTGEASDSSGTLVPMPQHRH